MAGWVYVGNVVFSYNYWSRLLWFLQTPVTVCLTGHQSSLVASRLHEAESTGTSEKEMICQYTQWKSQGAPSHVLFVYCRHLSQHVWLAFLVCYRYLSLLVGHVPACFRVLGPCRSRCVAAVRPNTIFTLATYCVRDDWSVYSMIVTRGHQWCVVVCRHLSQHVWLAFVFIHRIWTVRSWWNVWEGDSVLSDSHKGPPMICCCVQTSITPRLIGHHHPSHLDCAKLMERLRRR